jgi:alpha-L-rhamnosidase
MTKLRALMGLPKMRLSSGFWIALILVRVAHASPVDLRCESFQNPLCVDVATPHLSWRSESETHNWVQSEYQILVASSPQKLTASDGDVWDTGKVPVSESVGILYRGRKLAPRTRYFWRVRVWDQDGNESVSTQQAWWETGLLDQSEWQAQWISWKNPNENADRAAIRWIWADGQDALHTPPETAIEFETKFGISERPREAALFVPARGNFTVQVNGNDVGGKRDWSEFDREDVAEQLRVGENSIRITVSVPKSESADLNAASVTSKAGLAALLRWIRPVELY